MPRAASFTPDVFTLAGVGDHDQSHSHACIHHAQRGQSHMAVKRSAHGGHSLHPKLADGCQTRNANVLALISCAVNIARVNVAAGISPVWRHPSPTT